MKGRGNRIDCELLAAFVHLSTLMSLKTTVIIIKLVRLGSFYPYEILHFQLSRLSFLVILSKKSLVNPVKLTNCPQEQRCNNCYVVTASVKTTKLTEDFVTNVTVIFNFQDSHHKTFVRGFHFLKGTKKSASIVRYNHDFLR